MWCAAVGDTERGTLHVVIAAAAENSMQITDKADTHIEVCVPACGQCFADLAGPLQIPFASNHAPACSRTLSFCKHSCSADSRMQDTSAFDGETAEGLQEGDISTRVAAQITASTPALLAAGTSSVLMRTPCSCSAQALVGVGLSRLELHKPKLSMCQLQP